MSTDSRQSADTSATPTRGRWYIVIAAVLVQLALGAVYAWSVFNKPLQAEFGWSKSEAVLPFEVAIGTIFIGTFIGGRIQDRRGPRPVALAGVILYSVGIMLASRVSSSGQLWLLVLSYGVLGGIGLGLAYITPIAMLVKWFPDRRGLITGVAVGGFGFGAVITGPVAKWLLSGASNKPSVFLPLGIAYLVAGVLGASMFRNPPEGYTVPGYDPAAATGRAKPSATVYSLRDALHTRQWYLLTLILFLNTMCGIAFISQASDAAQDVTNVTATTAATFVGVMGLFNGAGRILWAALSDRIGRMQAFLGMLGLQGICFLLISHVAFGVFAVLGALIYLAYGGGFGTMPATAADFYGTANAGAIYGAMIVAWSAGGVIGPLIAARLFESSGGYTVPFTVLGIVALVSLVLPLLAHPPAPVTEGRPMRPATT
ncbi:MAG: transporter [Actinomycetia bacterium]|jgi:OFA family oxalate/formate antiporter-like MFS transporter|nr:transporter [Actinomycetes bacterium]MDQ1656713.1 transporter, family, oxalate/formate antiporter [Cryptosporangiaceae bacterium]